MDESERARNYLLIIGVLLHAHPRQILRSTINDICGNQSRTLEMIDSFGAKIYEDTKKVGNQTVITYGLTSWYYDEMTGKKS